jgi:hypothetical protein
VGNCGRSRSCKLYKLSPLIKFSLKGVRAAELELEKSRSQYAKVSKAEEEIRLKEEKLKAEMENKGAIIEDSNRKLSALYLEIKEIEAQMNLSRKDLTTKSVSGVAYLHPLN